MSASQSPKLKEVYEFGPFRVDSEKEILQRDGKSIPLQPKTFQILLVLIRHDHEVVTKDDLMKAVWPDTFVEEANLSRNIFMLRKALGESPQDHQYILTVPGRGYRLAESVHLLPEQEVSIVAAHHSKVQIQVKESKPWGWIAVCAIVAVGVLAFTAALVFWWSRPPGAPVVEAVTQLTDDGEPKSSFTKIVTDGVRLYFTEGARGSFKIVQVAVTGGSVAAVPTSLTDLRVMGLAAEGSALLAIEGVGPYPNPLWQVALPTGELRRLGTIDAQGASFFPDGRILFGRESDLYLAEKDGSNPRKLVSVESLIRQPSVSPDGQRLVFTVWSRAPASPEAIFESLADGSRLHAIVNSTEGGQPCCAEWSLDGRYILFQNRHEGRRDLWLLPMKAGFLQGPPQAIQLTNGPLSYTAPVMSRDGKQIFALGLKERGEVVRFDTKANEFVPFLSGISAFNPTFSRDGNWVAYTSYPDHSLWRSRPDGSDRLQLTYPPMQVYYPFISPDGKRVAYGNRKGEIYMISMDGGQPQRIAEKDASAANFSPDGNLLVFMNARDATHSELQFLDLRTGKRSVVADSQDLGGGQWVSANTLVGGSRDSAKLEIFDVRTQKWSDLVSGKVPGSVVNWAHSPDYQYVYYTTGGVEPKAMRIRLADHKVEAVASLKDLRRALGPDGNTQISVAPDGSPIFTRDIGTQEVYALSVKWH